MPRPRSDLAIVRTDNVAVNVSFLHVSQRGSYDLLFGRYHVFGKESFLQLRYTLV